MRRAISVVLIVIAAVYVFVIVTTHEESLVTTQRVSVPEAVNVSSIDFNATGTLVFYPNNVGSVPYLFYHDQQGRTVAKALIFSGASPTNFYSWTAARISVSGTLDHEHVVVDHIAYVSAP